MSTQETCHENARILIAGPRRGLQSQFVQSKATIAMWLDDFNTGKTTGLLLDWHRRSADPSARGVIMVPGYRNLRNPGGVLDMAKNMFDGRGVSVRVGARPGFTWPSGATLDIMALDNQGQLSGRAYSWIGVQRCEEFDWSTNVMHYVSRLRAPNVDLALRMVGDGPPRGVAAQLIRAFNRGKVTHVAGLRSHGPTTYVFGDGADQTAELARTDPRDTITFELVTGPWL